MNIGTLVRCSAWAAVATVAFVTLSPIRMRPITSAHVDVERMAAYAALGGVLFLAYPRHPVLLSAVIVAMAAILEAIQVVVPGRHGEFHDFGMKALAAVAGVAMAVALTRGVARRLRGFMTLLGLPERP